MAFGFLIYLALAMAWAVVPFLAMKQERFAVNLLVGHVALSAAAYLSAATLGEWGPAVIFCAGPGVFMSLFFIFLKVAFPDKKNGSS
ncbi:hypothetical protein [Streptomyces sp. NBC_01506]|uniref:hypothetical protein n=1 Tax=Streptomyces sp. NBC_01506 TaxID=2903887 RepID=UPI003865F62A